jgi:hypothetical protein
MTTPTPGSVVNSASVTFAWNAGTGVTQYWLEIGSAVGKSDLYGASAATNLSATANGLPTDGRILYVRLWSQLASGWQFNDYTYKAGPQAVMAAPAPQSILPNSTTTFTWNAGVGVNQYWLQVGTTAGASDLYNQSTGTALAAAVAALPTDGRTVYVRLWSLVGNSWLFTDYTYMATGAQRPVMAAPAPGSTLPGNAVAFGWSAGTGVTQYWLYVGNAPGTFDLYNQSTATARSVNLTGLPVDGRTLYVRLWSQVAGGWQFNDYTYRAANLPPGQQAVGSASTAANDAGARTEQSDAQSRNALNMMSKAEQ